MVVDQPQWRAPVVRIIPPAYTGMPAQDQAIASEIQLWPGSDVALTFSAQLPELNNIQPREISSAEVLVTGGPTGHDLQPQQSPDRMVSLSEDGEDREEAGEGRVGQSNKNVPSGEGSDDQVSIGALMHQINERTSRIPLSVTPASPSNGPAVSESETATGNTVSHLRLMQMNG